MTSNISKLYYDHISACRSRGGIHELHGLTGRQAIPVLREAFARIDSTRIKNWKVDQVGDVQFCAKYDAMNGWGSSVGGLIFLAQIMGACASYPRHKVSICA